MHLAGSALGQLISGPIENLAGRKFHPLVAQWDFPAAKSACQLVCAKEEEDE